MIDRNKNRPGYKKTKVGWIPEEWDCVRLRAVCNRDGQYGACASAIAFSAAKPRYVRITDILDVGRLQADQLVSIEPAQSQGYELHVNDFLFARTGATVGKTYLHKTSQGSYAFAGYLIRFIPNLSSIIPSFLQAFTQSPKYWRWVAENLHAGAQPNINAEEYGALPIPLPPLPEQKKIAEILSAWDEGIERTRQLITVAKCRKKALMQKLLTGKKRLPGFDGEWNGKYLSQLLRHVSRPAKKPISSYVAVGIRSHGKGTFQRIVEEPEKVMMDTLYQLHSGDLVVNITFAWEGAIAIADVEDEGCFVSHRFPAFEFIERKASRLFFKQLVRTQRFVWDLGLISLGSAGRNRVLNQTDFIKMRVQVPEYDEQQAIAAVLTAADDEIAALESTLFALEKQKQGLMQKLLTGEVRVKV